MMCLARIELNIVNMLTYVFYFFEPVTSVGGVSIFEKRETGVADAVLSSPNCKWLS